MSANLTLTADGLNTVYAHKLGLPATWWRGYLPDPFDIEADQFTPGLITSLLGLNSIRLVGVPALDVEREHQKALVSALDFDSNTPPAVVIDAVFSSLAASLSNDVGMVLRDDPNTGESIVVAANHGLQSYHHSMPQTIFVADALGDIVSQIQGRGVHGGLDTAGLLGERGGKAFASVKLLEYSVDPDGIDDTIEVWATFVDSCDMSSRAVMYVSSVRPVCQNTVSYGMAKAFDMVSFRHSSGMPAAMAAGLTEMAQANIGQAATIAAHTNRLLTVSADDAWSIAFNELAPISPDQTSAQNDSSRGFRERLRELAETDPTNFPTTGVNAWGVINTLTGNVRNHREPKRRAVAAAKNADGVMTTESVALWRGQQADAARLTGQADSETKRVMAAVARIGELVSA